MPRSHRSMAQTGWFPAKPCKQEDDHAAGLRSLDSTGAAHGSQCRNNQLPRKSVDLISTLHHFDHVAPSSSCPGPKSWPAKSLSQESLAGAASAMENEHGVHYLATGVALRLPIVVYRSFQLDSEGARSEAIRSHRSGNQSGNIETTRSTDSRLSMPWTGQRL